VEEAKAKGVLAFGPFPADGFFGSGQYNKFDGILAMYHDQGLVPFKALSFGAGVNYTAGLQIVRTSPDHGTAYDIAGKGEADEISFIKALYLAAEIVRNRNEYLDMHANSLERRKQKALISETGDDEEVIMPEE
jgi:4-hydroxythreonine-4-phosphate dehydrogenase